MEYKNFDYENKYIGVYYHGVNLDEVVSIVLLDNQQELEKNIEQIIYDAGGYVLQKIWQSKYNEYVTYDYEPFGVGGFYIEFHLPQTKTSHFVAREIILHTENIIRLEKQLELKTEVNN